MGWQDDLIPQDATVDIEGKPTPLREVPFVKEAPDVTTFVKRAFDTHREVGARIPVKKLDKPEEVVQWQKDHLPKLYTAGLLEAPPTDAAGYEIKKPDDLHEGVNWSDERATKFAELGLKHRIPKAAMTEFLELHRSAVAGFADTLKTSYDEGMTELKREYGDALDERMEMAKRLTDVIFKKPEELEFIERTGIGNHPVWLKILARLAPFAQQDSSLVESMGSGDKQITAENREQAAADVRSEVSKIMSDPKHPDYEGYWRGDEKIMKKIDDMYRKVYGSEKVVIDTVLVAGG